jgi:hypothetical protein
MTRDLMALADYLEALGVTHVAMESTGVLWKPVWNILDGRFKLLLVNPRQVKQVPGRKSDVKDAEKRWTGIAGKRWTCVATRLTAVAAANRSLVYLVERTALHCMPEPVSSRSRTRSFCVARRGSAGLPRVTQRDGNCPRPGIIPPRPGIIPHAAFPVVRTMAFDGKGYEVGGGDGGHGFVMARGR